MAVVYKRALAEQDLIKIWLYTWQEWGEEQADRSLEQAMKMLAQHPHIAYARREFTPAVRIHPHAHHFVIYQPQKDGISVVRVLHKNMDVELHLDL
jgi:toxin ParE1/3/4